MFLHEYLVWLSHIVTDFFLDFSWLLLDCCIDFYMTFIDFLWLFFDLLFDSLTFPSLCSTYSWLFLDFSFTFLDLLLTLTWLLLNFDLTLTWLLLDFDLTYSWPLLTLTWLCSQFCSQKNRTLVNESQLTFYQLFFFTEDDGG